ncbi:hypothetical protein N9C27_03310 [Luminiphilus sp.]|nr:hypothetical protein [Luminiphilus sp.]
MKVEIEEVIANPLAHLEPPFSEADYFELFYRLDLLKDHIEKIRGASYEFEEARSTDLKAARKARDTIKRYTHTEEMRRRTRDWQEIPLGEQQQQLILDSIVSREVDPQAIPRHPGKRGIKAEIKQALRQEHKNIFRSDYSFDEAWKRLRKKEVIKDA